MQAKNCLTGIIGLIGALLFWPTAASAQTFVCPNGPGPGEVQVGTTGGSHGVAAIPICASDGRGSPEDAPDPTPSSSHAVLVWHPDAADVWVAGNYVYKDNVGESVALRECKMVMGEGCTKGDGWRNSSITIIRDHNGDFYNSWESEGRKKVLNECSAKQLLPCEVFAKIKSSTSKRSPGASVRKYYAASAWVKGDEGYDNKLYVASGYRTADEAIEAAVKGCGNATSRQCETNAWTGNGFIQTYRVDSNHNATSENSSNRAKEAAQAGCKKFKAKSCILQAQYDSRTSGLFVHDYGPTKAP
ncbi:MAG: hypothetical protein WAT18_07295 [Sphingorhabdus sp.]